MCHLRKIKVLLAICMLACASLWAQDTKITISNATASSYHNDDHRAANAIDGDFETIWHSNWNNIPSFPVTFVITLEKVSHVDYVRYTPRLSGTNGNWKEVEVSYSTSTSGSSFTSPVTYDLKGATFDFPIGAICGQIKFTIYPGETDNGKKLASAAEIAAYAYDTAKPAAFAEYFNGDVYSELKPGVTSSDGIADADVKALVDAMLTDAAEYKKFRVGEYEPYMTTATVKRNLKVSSQYNNYENPTGIYLKPGESCFVAVSGINASYPVGLKIKDWYNTKDLSSYPLHNGLNYITATTEGNVFVNYYTDDFASVPNVQMHFINAPVLGYWDQATMTNADWEAMLAGPLAKDDVIIITRSKHAQTAYPIGQWKQHCPTDINTTMTFYQQVQWAERDMLGLDMFGRQVKNRQLFYGDKCGIMAAGGDASYCGYESLRVLMVPDASDFDFWGVGHEWGHNNQMTGFHWSGCGETTNNIPASWAQFHFTGNRNSQDKPAVLRLEDEVTGINDYVKMRGGRMQTYFEEGLRKGVAWQLQDGPDYHNATPETKTVTGRDADGKDLGQVTTTSRNYDHFVKLSPFWQLNLWGTLAERSPYIITKVLEHIRITDNYEVTYNTNGKQQINWMKLACEAAKMDLLPFFEKAGMLRPIHAYIEDYGEGWNIITKEMIDELKASVAAEVAAGRYQEYPNEEINYINGHNYHIYRDRLKLNITEMQGEPNGDKVIIQHSVAQNAVAFETYNAQDELIRITMYGLGSDDEHSFTQVLYPVSFDEKENAAYIMAVGYDGERQRVYQTYASEDDAKYGELGRILAGVEAMLQFCDEDETKVGYYKPSALTDLRTAYNTAKSVYDNQQSVSYVAVYDMLSTEFMKVQNDATARVGIVEGYAYRLTSKAYPTLSMSVGANDVMIGEQTNDNDEQKWYFEGSGTEGYYYLKNKATNTYPGDVQTGQPLSLDKTTRAEAHAYKLQDMGDGIWALVGATGLHCSASQSYNIVGWGTDAHATQWYITAVVIDSNAEALHNLRSLIGKTEALIAEVEGDASYSSISTALSQAKSQVTTAKAALEAGNSSAYDALNTKYTALLNAKNSVDNAALDVLKNQLSTLIDNTNSLISQCGEVIYTPATFTGIPSLQTADVTADYYVWTNSQSTQEVTNEDPYRGYLKNLVDGNNDTYFHSDYSGANSTDGLDHHITINMGVANAVSSFSFEYRTRSDASYQFPSEIEVYGSTDNVNYDLLKTISSGLPTTPNSVFTSSVIEVDKPYTYLRIMVTKNNNGTTKGDHQFFHMAELVLNVTGVSESYSVNSHNIGDVTEDMLLATFKQNQEAHASCEMATTEAQLQKAIDRLQAQYDALLEAKAAVRYQDYTVRVEGTRDNSSNAFGVEYQGEKYHDGDILNAPTTLTANQLEAINETASHQLERIVVADGVITVIYVPLYVVNVNGISDMGGVTFGGNLYGAGDEFPASSLDGLEAVEIGGYEVEMIVNEMYINVSYYKNYTITIEGVSNNESERVCVQYKSTEYVNGNVIRTLGEIDENYLSLVAPHYYAVEHFMVDHDASRIIVEFINKSYLNILVGEITNMLTDCGAYNYDFAEVDNARIAKEAAEAVYNDYLVSASDYRDALNNLQSAKEALANAIQTESSNRQASREALRGQIEALRNVIAECGVVEFGRYPNGRTEVSLTEANLSTNAQEKSEGPIANLLKDDDSFFHSSWQGGAGAAHYLQVDLGEGKSLQEFVFGYTTRNNGPHPHVIVVSGSNSPDGSFEEIKVFNYSSRLPNTGSTSWEASAPIVSSQPYRYLRFTVTKSSNLRSYGEYCFAMSKFELKTIAYSENEDYYVEYLNPNGSVTEEQLLDAYLTMIAAGDLDNDYTSKSDLDAKIDELQSLCDELSSALNDLQLPVVLTTDMESPVLYTIKSKRGDTKVLQYDPAEGHMFSIADASSDNAKQLFYFTVGDTRTQVYVHPFAAGEQVLAADNTENGAAKVFAREKGAASYDQWVFVKREQEYNLQPVGASTYFSNFNGGTAKMGFYASSPDSDAGSLFSFASASIEGSAAYHSLKVYYDEVTKVKSAEIEGGSNPYYYPKQEADAYNEAYANTTDLLGTMTSAYVDYLEAYKALKAANEVLELNMPSADKFYRFVSADTKNDRVGGIAYADPANNKMYWSKEKGTSDATAIWSITASDTEGKYNVTNLHTGSSINGFINYNPSPLRETAGDVNIVSLSGDGQVGIKCNGTMMHAAAADNAVVHWETGANDASAWLIEEVDMSKVKHTVSISQYEHAGLYLNYPVTIPDGVKAYYLDSTKITIDNGVGSLNLTKIEDDVIPAKTAVILYAPHGNNQPVGYDFEYTEAQGGEYNNLFTGSAYQTYREAEDGHRYYVFGQMDGEIGLYKNSVKYDASGSDGTTHYKMSANKILFDWNDSHQPQQVMSFRFRLGGQVTDVEDKVVEDNAIIYDLYGRRILEVTSSGLYIINGEKRYIQVK